MDIRVIGIGVGDQASLTDAALAALLDCSLVVGAPRQLAMVKHLLGDTNSTTQLPPLTELDQQLQRWQREDKRSIAILASGDPLFYGIGAWLYRNWPSERLRCFPAVSSIQAACNELGIPLQQAKVVSLHGRAKEALRRHLHPNTTLIILTDHHSHPKFIAQECLLAGYAAAQIAVCEQLGCADQRIVRREAVMLSQADIEFHPLQVTVVSLATPEFSEQSVPQPSFPGIPDAHFITEAENGAGMITKRETRLVILSHLQPASGDLIWDVGAGCGSVAIELAYWQENAQVYAVEHNPQRFDKLQKNRLRFGVVNNLTAQLGRAPAVLNQLPDPNKVFLGGSDGELAVTFSECWQRLPVGGLLVACAVTEDTRNHLFQLQQKYQSQAEFESVQVMVSRGQPLGTFWSYRPQLPVVVFCWRKLGESMR